RHRHGRLRRRLRLPHHVQPGGRRILVRGEGAMKRLLAGLLVAGCSAHPQLPPVDPGLGAFALAEVHPQLILPSTEIDLVGDGFVDPTRGTSRLELRGTFTPATGDAQAIDVVRDASVADATRLTAAASAAFFAALPSSTGHFDGVALI